MKKKPSSKKTIINPEVKTISDGDQMIRVAAYEPTIISDGSSITIPVYEVVTVEDGSTYKKVDVMTYDEMFEVRHKAENQIAGLIARLESYKKFHRVIQKLKEASAELRKVKKLPK